MGAYLNTIPKNTKAKVCRKVLALIRTVYLPPDGLAWPHAVVSVIGVYFLALILISQLTSKGLIPIHSSRPTDNHLVFGCVWKWLAHHQWRYVRSVPTWARLVSDIFKWCWATYLAIGSSLKYWCHCTIAWILFRFMAIWNLVLIHGRIARVHFLFGVAL